VAPRTVVDSLNSSSSDVASSDSGAGCLPTYEQHLELQQKCCGMALPSSVSSLQTSNLSDSLQALGLGPLTSKLIASSTSADCWQHSLSEETTPVATDDTDYHRQPVFSDIPVTTTPTSVRVCTAQFGKKWGKSLNLNVRISRPGKVWTKAMVLERFQKIWLGPVILSRLIVVNTHKYCVCSESIPLMCSDTLSQCGVTDNIGHIRWMLSPDFVSELNATQKSWSCFIQKCNIVVP